jgi:Fe-S-cluster-containing hydrogenase component 2
MGMNDAMKKKLLIDLDRLRKYKEVPVEGLFKRDEYALSFKSIRELATFMFTCRKCEKAPCIDACPAGALERTGQGMVSRSQLRCIHCKSCVFICPFGTLMDNLFEVKDSQRKFINLRGEAEMKEFASFFPDDVITLVDGDEDPSAHIYRFNEQILIKEYTWQ